MSFEFVGHPTLVLKYSAPNLKAAKVGVQSAQWDGKATVPVKNEHRRKLAHWVRPVPREEHDDGDLCQDQALRGFDPTGLMPVLDADDNHNYRPFYDDDSVDMASQPKDVETALATPQVDVAVK